jgi:predicted lipoprotein with Yx(FWY)xxD motif
VLASRARTDRRVACVAALAVAAAALVLAAPSFGSRSATVTTRASSYGTILFDGRGFVLYVFTRDSRTHSLCTGACAKAWPPYLARGRLEASAGAVAKLLGTIRRADGTTQITYAGRPLYYYVGDRMPGQILCQDVSEYGGRWLVVRPTGKPVR